MARDRDATRLNLPVDLDVLLACAEADDNTASDAEAATAGARVAERLLRSDRGANSATVTALESRRERMRVPGWTVRPLAASADDVATHHAVQRQVDRELGVEFVRSPSGAARTRISVRAFGARAVAGDIVRVGAEGTEVLVVLYPDEGGTLTGQVVTRALTMSEDLEISLLPSAALDARHTSAVTEAVRCSLTAGRNAWRRVAKGLPSGDPIRAAIVEGLS
ncbi:hypothetical protein [Nocardia lasii]|uniref:Uncharacterized protein n=1 Tax=Nocardia lasii TaxID=1616107 RepID=A0ABW1JQ87_9NOCA